MSSILTTQAFYALTLINSSATTAAVTCHLVPRLPKLTSQILEARGSRLYLYYVKAQAAKTDAETATVSIVTVFEQDVFSIVRGLTCFRIPGAKTGMYCVCHPRICTNHAQTALSSPPTLVDWACTHMIQLTTASKRCISRRLANLAFVEPFPASIWCQILKGDAKC